MKVVQFMASEKWGGAEKVFVDLSNELSRKHEVAAILLRNTEYRGRFSKRVEIIELKAHPTTHNPLLLWELFRVLKETNPHIVHTHAVKASLLIHRLRLFLQIKHLGTKHNARKGKIFNKLNWVSVVSLESERTVKLAEKSRLKVIYNGTKVYARTDKHVIEGDATFKIAAIGRLDAIKGFDILIQQVHRISSPFELVIAGQGPEEKKLLGLIEKLKLGDRVTLAGFSDNIPELMKNSHMVVISSHSEGFPQVMVESLFYANVLVSTPVGGVKEVLPKKFLTKQSELSEKIVDVYENYEDYKSSFKQIQDDRAKDFDLSKICSEYEKYYSEILRLDQQ